MGVQLQKLTESEPQWLNHFSSNHLLIKYSSGEFDFFWDDVNTPFYLKKNSLSEKE